LRGPALLRRGRGDDVAPSRSPDAAQGRHLPDAGRDHSPASAERPPRRGRLRRAADAERPHAPPLRADPRERAPRGEEGRLVPRPSAGRGRRRRPRGPRAPAAPRPAPLRPPPEPRARLRDAAERTAPPDRRLPQPRDGRGGEPLRATHAGGARRRTEEEPRLSLTRRTARRVRAAARSDTGATPRRR